MVLRALFPKCSLACCHPGAIGMVALLATIFDFFCGNPCFSDGVAMGAGQHRGDTGTSEPDLARTSCHCLGRIAVQVPVSYLARTCLQSLV